MSEPRDVIKAYCEKDSTVDAGNLLWAATELQKQNDDLSIKLQRTVSAAYHALLEMSAWLGIPEKKRKRSIEHLMENVRHCAEHDLRHIEESNAVLLLKKQNDELKAQLEIATKALKSCLPWVKAKSEEEKSIAYIDRGKIYEALSKIEGEK